ncbi:MAG: response regulator [Acidobacteria bacterium]|nr:MAG: response regulator [Acidobacteriota bacterium]
MQRKFQIVVVEDNEPDVFLVREALQLAGLDFELHAVDNGENAVEFIDKVEGDDTLPRPDLVLLDLNLPKKGGGLVLERVRRSPTCGHVPVVVLTSSDSPQDKAQAARLGATQYFRKPSRLEEFMKLGPLVRELLDPEQAG